MFNWIKEWNIKTPQLLDTKRLLNPSLPSRNQFTYTINSTATGTLPPPSSSPTSSPTGSPTATPISSSHIPQPLLLTTKNTTNSTTTAVTEKIPSVISTIRIPTLKNVFNWKLYHIINKTILVRISELGFSDDLINSVKPKHFTHGFAKHPLLTKGNLRSNAYIINQGTKKSNTIGSDIDYNSENITLPLRNGVKLGPLPWVKESNDSTIANVLFTIIEKNAMTKMRTFLLYLFDDIKYVAQQRRWFKRTKLDRLGFVRNITKYCQTSIFDQFEAKLLDWTNSTRIVGYNIENVSKSKHLSKVEYEELKTIKMLKNAFFDPAANPSAQMMIHYYTTYAKKLQPENGSTDGLVYMSYYLNVMRNKLNKKWVKLVILRDPMERLVSGFVDECLNDHRHFCEDVEFPYETRNQTLNFSYIKQFGTIDYNQHCELSYSSVELNIDEKIDMFEKFVQRLYEKVYDKNYYWRLVNVHYTPQIFYGILYHVIEYFDYIVIYNKNTFHNDIWYIFNQILVNKYNIINNTLSDNYWKHWGYFNNQSLFDEKLKTVHTNVENVESEMYLLKRYFANVDILNKAIQLYKYDYMLLPFVYPPKFVT